jgi:hypothetical protein
LGQGTGRTNQHRKGERQEESAVHTRPHSDLEI